MERAWSHAAHEQPFGMLIDGREVRTQRTISVISPWTGEVFSHAPRASAADLEAAVSAAQGAFPSWSSVPLAQRRRTLQHAADALTGHSVELASILSMEQGKPKRLAVSEVQAAVSWIRQVAALEYGEGQTSRTESGAIEVRRVPLGVVGAIVPWNYPVMLAVWKLAPALLTGNTLVLKPSPFTPLVTLRIGQILRAVFAPGVLNVLSGADDLGPWMSGHRGIAKIAFTGSTETGRRVMQSAAGSLKRLTLELGGNDAAIVLNDVDPAAIAKKLFWAAFVNSGQLCVASKRIFVHEAVYDDVLRNMTALAGRVKVGPDPDTSDIGPIQNRVQYERVRSLIDDCGQQGFRLACGGEPFDGKGYFVSPTIVDDPPDESRVVREEAFGPIVPLMRFADVDEAVHRANASDYGLAASIWSRDQALAQGMARRLQAGTVWINQIHALLPRFPMAGHKQSGFGVENGLDGLLAYTLPQTIMALAN